LEPRIAPDGPIRSAQDYRARFPDGRIASDPSLANAADGDDLLDLAARALVDDFNAFSHAA
jgi:creatinine amidohydrolase